MYTIVLHTCPLYGRIEITVLHGGYELFRELVDLFMLPVLCEQADIVKVENDYLYPDGVLVILEASSPVCFDKDILEERFYDAMDQDAAYDTGIPTYLSLYEQLTPVWG